MTDEDMKMLEELSDDSHKHVIKIQELEYIMEWLFKHDDKVMDVTRDEAKKMSRFQQIMFLDKFCKSDDIIGHLMCADITKFMWEVQPIGFLTAGDVWPSSNIDASALTPSTLWKTDDGWKFPDENFETLIYYDGAIMAAAQQDGKYYIIMWVSRVDGTEGTIWHYYEVEKDVLSEMKRNEISIFGAIRQSKSIHLVKTEPNNIEVYDIEWKQIPHGHLPHPMAMVEE